MGTAYPCVLIVEDDEDIREALVEVVRGAGCVPATACHGLEALQYLRGCTELPTLVLLDLMMPVMDGREFLRRREDRMLGVPVVVLTAGSTDGLPSDVRAIKKPISMNLLLDALGPCWGASAQSPERRAR